MALDNVTLYKLLSYLNDMIVGLEEKKVTTKKLSTDEDLMFSVEHRLHTAIDAVINISEHIIAGLNLGHVDTAKDAIKLLAKHKIIPQNLGNKLGKAADMRNILVHQYFEVDVKEVAIASTENLDDLRDFTKVISEFLEKQTHTLKP